ncbi:MAG: sensor histidine kinase [Proteobacteria bacterium]|nr:sensor histidine kinase [Pseudomonadota bacterium]
MTVKASRDIEVTAQPRVSPRLAYRRLPFTGLTGRILALNVLGLAALVAGIFYVNQYRTGLIEARMTALQAQAVTLAGALGETASGGPDTTTILADDAQGLLLRLTVNQDSRVRVFQLDGTLAIDSRDLLPASQVTTETLLPPGEKPPADMKAYWRDFRAWAISVVTTEPDYPVYEERFDQTASDYPEVMAAFNGTTETAVRVKQDDSLVLTVAVPVQRLRRVLGAILVSVETTEIEEVVRQERLAIIEIFLVALGVMVLLSLLLAGTIARPVRRLAAFAHAVRQGRGRDVPMPEFSRRMDEVGDLSRALRDMTQSLYQRIDTIEAFAADVAHEFKNPLTSLRSAVETMERTDNPEHHVKLTDIIKDDVRRLGRLISDISNASRLDAELLRAEMEIIDVPHMLSAITGMYDGESNGMEDAPCGPRIELSIEGDGLKVDGLESHLGQILRNLIDNAISFSPDGGLIRVAAKREQDILTITVEDDGPGIPADKVTKIFDRFYSERPESQGFGNHSGLGLNICRQIVLVHNGAIRAENRYGPRGADGSNLGARFVITLPVSRTRRPRPETDANL